jgi:hypothetical protein
MLAALTQLRERAYAAAGPLAERLAPAVAVVSDVYALVLPYAIKVFHYGFIPLVIALGMRSEPRPKLVDLLTPL